MTIKDELQSAFNEGRRWIGWGEGKGCPVTYVVHRCPQHGDVSVRSIDDLTRWLREHAPERIDCWEDAMAHGLAADQQIWTSAYSAARHAERAVTLLRDRSRWQEARSCAEKAARLGQSVCEGFDPWGRFHRAVVRATQG